MDQIIESTAENTLPAAARAVQITERIRANGRTAVNAVCAIGEDLRTMNIDKLYVELGYETFEDYAEKEFQLKRRQAYQYISVFEKLGKEFVQSNAQLGITKLALLATANPEDRTDVMESEDLANITTRELEQLLAEKKQQGEQLSMFEENLQKSISNEQEQQRKISELERELDNLKNAPKDVEVATEVKEIIKEIPDQKTAKKLAETEAALEKAKKDLKASEKEREMYKKSADNARALAHNKAEQEIKTIKEQAEREKEALRIQISELQAAAEKPADNQDKSNFKAMLSTVYKDMLGLLEYVKNTESDDEREMYFKKALEILNACKESILAIENKPKIDMKENEEDE